MPSRDIVPASADPQKFLERIMGALASGAESVEVYVTAKKKLMLCIWWKK